MILWTLMMWKITSNKGVLWDVSCGLEWSQMKGLLIAKWHFLTPWSCRPFQNSMGFSAPIFIILLVHIYFPCLKLPCLSNLPFGFLFWGCCCMCCTCCTCRCSVLSSEPRLCAGSRAWTPSLPSHCCCPCWKETEGRKGLIAALTACLFWNTQIRRIPTQFFSMKCVLK